MRFNDQMTIPLTSELKDAICQVAEEMRVTPSALVREVMDSFVHKTRLQMAHGMVDSNIHKEIRKVIP